MQGASRAIMFNDDNSQFDDDGNPKTIQAAVKKFHSNNKTLYCADTSYKS
jgi:hypothetical protein